MRVYEKAKKKKKKKEKKMAMHLVHIRITTRFDVEAV